MNNIKNNRSSVFEKLFVSYLLISIVPLVVLGSLFYYYNVINFEKNVKENNLDNLKQVKNQINLDLKVLKDVTYHISNNPEMLNEYKQYPENIISQLKAYSENCMFLDDILFYAKGDKSIYSTLGYYYYYDFESYIKKEQNWSKSSFFKQINSLLASKIMRIDDFELTPEKNNRLITLMYPVPYLSTSPQATIVYTIKEEYILSKFENFLGDFTGYIYVFDNQYNLIISNDKVTNISGNDVLQRKFMQHKGTGIFETSIDNNRYIAMRIVSEDTGWSYIVAMPPKQFYKSVNNMRSVVLAIIFILLLSGLVLAYILSNRNYKPIQTLITYIKNKDTQSINFEGKNEIEMFRFSFENNYTKYRELTVQIDAQRPFVRDQCLIKIIRGKVKDIQDLDYLLKCSNIQFQGENYFVMVLSTRNDDTEKINMYSLSKLLEQIFFTGSKGFGVELVQEKMIAIIISVENQPENFREVQLELANDVLMLVEKNIGVKPIIGIGNAYKDIMMLNTSFLEASSVLYDNFTTNSSSIFIYNDLKKLQDQVNWYSIIEQSLYIESLKHGDKVVALETFNSMIKAIKDNTTSYLMVRCLCFDILNNVIKSINKMNIEKFNGDISQLAKFNTLDEFEESMKDFSEQFCEYVDQLKDKRTNELKNSIIKYVNDHYTSEQISLDDIACRFDVSSIYVSRFFKEETGVNFTEYITNLRMNYIKKQLSTTDKSIKVIASEAGYIDPASFTRKFRSIEGITPGQYRKMIEENK